MMKKLVVWTLVMGLTASVASAETTLNLRVESGASSAIMVTPGQPVDYQVIGWLTDTDNNEGLALFGFDLAYDCGTLAQASAPDTPEMAQFVMPEGINNPQGFGGTVDVPGKEGELVQIGGATNSINNVDTFAPYPLGTVVLGMGHGETVLAEGSLTIPGDATDEQVCNLVASDVFANTILLGETDDGTYWAVEATNQQGADPENLAMTVSSSVILAVAATPGCDVSLTRPSNNLIRIEFGDTIAAPTAGEFQVRELLADGNYGASDLAGSLDISVEGGNVLRIAEAGSPVLANETWYGVFASGWSGVGDFKVDFKVVFGDANNSGFTNFADLSFINANFADPTTDWDVNDINGSGFVNFADLSAAFANNDMTAPDKPTGHTCSIP